MKGGLPAMTQLQLHWKLRGEKKAELDGVFPAGWLYVQPMENAQLNVTAGLATAVSTEIAARLILAGSHCVATALEVAALHEHGERNKRASEAMENRQNNKTVLSLQVDRPATARKAGKE
jgi:hypothetical protein